LLDDDRCYPVNIFHPRENELVGTSSSLTQSLNIYGTAWTTNLRSLWKRIHSHLGFLLSFYLSREKVFIGYVSRRKADFAEVFSPMRWEWAKPSRLYH
jgi:hypothetical protein